MKLKKLIKTKSKFKQKLSKIRGALKFATTNVSLTLS